MRTCFLQCWLCAGLSVAVDDQGPRPMSRQQPLAAQQPLWREEAMTAGPLSNMNSTRPFDEDAGAQLVGVGSEGVEPPAEMGAVGVSSPSAGRNATGTGDLAGQDVSLFEAPVLYEPKSTQWKKLSIFFAASSSLLQFQNHTMEHDAPKLTEEDVATQFGFTPEQITEFRDAFNVYDTDGNGEITKLELGAALRKAGQNPTIEEIQDMIATVDKDGNSSIDFPEFLVMMGRELEKKGLLVELFNRFAPDGELGKSALRSLMISLNIPKQKVDSQLDGMFELADTDGNGTLSFKEFYLAMR